MSEAKQPTDAGALREELEDRLADLALSETLGGKRPPDLSQAVLAASRQPRRSWRTIAMLAVAASLLVACGLGLWLNRLERNQMNSSQVAFNSARARAVETGRDFATQLTDEDAMQPDVAESARPSVEYTASNPTYETKTHDTLRAPKPGPVMRTTDAPHPIAADPLQPTSQPYEAAPSDPQVNRLKMDPAPVGDKTSRMSISEAKGMKPGRPGKDGYVRESEGMLREAAETPHNPAGEATVTNEFSKLVRGEPARTGEDRFQVFGKDSNGEAKPDSGRGAGQAGDRYSRIVENPFLKASDNPLSTFSIDVDTASYAKARRYLMQNRMLPPPDAVRIEEFVNYFKYDYPPPADDKPFAAHVEVAACPWQPAHRLVRIGLKGREIEREARPTSNLVFLLDVSGSMQPDDRLPRVRRSMRMLVEQLGENDRVAIVVYAGASGLVLPSTPGYRKEQILTSLDNLHAGGSTNGGAGIRLAYDAATANFIKGGTNRVILCTDGDFNVGTTSTGELERLAEEKAKSNVFLTVLGFGMGNHNDDMLEKLADKGNGNYGYIDTEEEARKLLVEELSGTLVTIAKDVKIQVEFNPRTVTAYRLLGYENRMLRAEDFNDDKKDAGEIGAGHTVTALYEIVPPGEKLETPPVDPLRYQQTVRPADAVTSGELLTLKLRYKEPDGQESKAPLIFPVTDRGQQFGQASRDFKFAAAVAGFAMLLRDSQHRGNFTYDAVLEIAQDGRGEDRHGYRGEFLEIVKRAKAASGK